MKKKCFTHEFKKGTKFTFFCSKFAWNCETKKFHMQSNQFCWKGYFTKQPFFREIRNSFRIKSSRNTNERNSRPWPCLYPYCPSVRGGGDPSTILLQLGQRPKMKCQSIGWFCRLKKILPVNELHTFVLNYWFQVFCEVCVIKKI